MNSGADHYARAFAKQPSGLVRSQLEKMLASEIFSRSERLSRFLRYIVEQSLDAQADGLKESVLAAELYGRGFEFEAATDPIVRVDARRLRDKLREYYSEADRDPVIISLPKGSYVPVFRLNPAAPIPTVMPSIAGAENVPHAALRTHWRRWLIATACLLAFIAASMMWREWHIRSVSSTELKIVPLTVFPGEEGPPSLSPDGNVVAFAWTGSDKPGVQHIWVKAVGGEALRQLTDGAASETSPAWSPDGREIAFVRAGQGVYIVSQLGGLERKIASSGTHVGWSADGQSVLIRDRAGDAPFGIFQILIKTLDRRQLTHAPAGIGDWTFAVSPDGKTLAFSRCERPGVGDLYLASMDGGEPKRLTDWNDLPNSMAWTPDSSELIYSVQHQLWRISVRRAGTGRGARLPVAVAAAHSPSISRPGPGRPARLAFQTIYASVGLRLIDLEAPLAGDMVQAVTPLFDSTHVDIPGRFSQDAKEVAFTSERSGGPELWVGNREGGNLRQMTDMGSPELLAGTWSPDGRRIAFDAVVDGNSDIYVINDQRGQPKRLTSEPSIDMLACWSGDGRWIYYTSNRSGRLEVWKVPADGGQTVQITRDGGFEPIESSDGKSLFYLSRPHLGLFGPSGPGILKQLPFDGGAETVVLGSVPNGRWAATDKGIFFITAGRETDAIDLYRFSDQKATRVGRLPFQIPRIGTLGRLTASRDGRWALTNQVNRWDVDLALVDNFH